MLFLHVSSALQGVITHALATPMPAVNCPPSLPSCGGATTNIFITILLVVIEFVVDLAVALALLFVLWAGLSMVLAMGDEGKISKAKNHILYALGGVAVALASQSIYSIFIQNYSSGMSFNDFIFGGLFPTLAHGIQIIFNPLFILSIIIAAIRMVLARGKEDEFTKARTMLLWSVVGAIVVNLAFTIVKIVIDIVAP